MAKSSNVHHLPGLLTSLEGSRRDLLVALRHRLAAAFDDPRTQPRDLSPLSLRLLEIQREISDLDEAELPARRVSDRRFNLGDI